MAAQAVGVQLDAHRGQGATANGHLANAFHLRQPLGQHGGGQVVQGTACLGVGGQGQNQDGAIGQVDLAVGRVVGHARGQQGTRGVDGGLHIARGAIDVAVQLKLQGDTGVALR